MSLRRIPKIILLFLLVSAASPKAPLPPEFKQNMDLLLGPDDPSFFNGGLLLASEGRLLAYKTAGFADFANRSSLTRDSVFPLASSAKPFTSVAVLQLRDRGRLQLDDAVAQHLAGFPYSKITVRHLLTHTSGLPDLELFEPLIAQKPTHVVSGNDLVPALIAWQKPARFPPGDQFRYSNINYQLLAEIVATVSKKPFATYVRDEIFRPTGMNSSYVLGSRALGQHREPVTRHVHAVMFRVEPENVQRLNYPDAKMMRPYRYEGFNLGSTVGDQNLFSTLGDLMKFDRALRAGKLLSLASQTEAYAPVRLNTGKEYEEPAVYDLYGSKCSYGMGWEVCSHPARGRLVGHAGSSRGIATILYRELDSGTFAAMFDNGDTADFAQKFASTINILHGEPTVAIPRQRSAAREYGQALVQEGPVAALLLLNRLRLTSADKWVTTKAGINRLGYDLLRNGNSALALEPFRINILLHPNDASVYDSYGEALAVNGRRTDAILAYKRSLELNSNNDKARAALQALEAN